MASIRVSRGLTVNLGNYESARYDYEVVREVEDSMEEISRVSDELEKFVESQLLNKLEELSEARGDDIDVSVYGL